MARLIVQCNFQLSKKVLDQSKSKFIEQRKKLQLIFFYSNVVFSSFPNTISRKNIFSGIEIPLEIKVYYILRYWKSGKIELYFYVKNTEENIYIALIIFLLRT